MRNLTEKEIRVAELEETIENLAWALNQSKTVLQREVEKAIEIIKEFGIKPLKGGN